MSWIVVDGQTRQLSDASLNAIAMIATSTDDVKAVFASVGIPFRRAQPITGSGVGYVPGVRSHTKESLQALDLSDPEQVGRVLRAVPQLVQLYEASKEADGSKLVRLEMALEADGFHVGRSGDFVAAFSDLALSAGAALSGFTGIRAEIRRSWVVCREWFRT